MNSKVAKISVSITTAQAEAIRDAVREGAMRRPAMRCATPCASGKTSAATAPTLIANARRLWDEGLASGFAEPRHSAEEIKAAGRERLAKRRGA